jgi:hypothetical protein
MTDYTVPPSMPGVALSPHRAGFPLSAAAVRAAGSCYNWGMGRGMVAHPWQAYDWTLDAGSVYDVPARHTGYRSDGQRRYFLDARGDGDCTVEVWNAISTGGSKVYEFPIRPTRTGEEDRIAAAVASRRRATTSNDRLVIKPTGSNVTIKGFGTADIPRPYLHASNSNVDQEPNFGAMPVRRTASGVPITVFSPARPYSPFHGQGQTALQTLQVYQDFRTQFFWTCPVRKDAAVITTFARSNDTTTYEPVFSLPVPVLGEIMRRGTTTRVLQCAVLAWKTGGASNGDVRFTRGKTSTAATINVSQTAPSVVQTVNLTIDAEDITTADGLRGGTWETVQVDFRSGTASSPFYVGMVAMVGTGTT